MTVTRLRHARHVIVWQPFVRLPTAGQPEVRWRVLVPSRQRWCRLDRAAAQNRIKSANTCAKNSRPVGHDPSLFRLKANSSPDSKRESLQTSEAFEMICTKKIWMGSRTYREAFWQFCSASLCPPRLKLGGKM